MEKGITVGLDIAKHVFQILCGSGVQHAARRSGIDVAAIFLQNAKAHSACKISLTFGHGSGSKLA